MVGAGVQPASASMGGAPASLADARIEMSLVQRPFQQALTSNTDESVASAPVKTKERRATDGLGAPVQGIGMRKGPATKGGLHGR